MDFSTFITVSKSVRPLFTLFGCIFVHFFQLIRYQHRIYLWYLFRICANQNIFWLILSLFANFEAKRSNGSKKREVFYKCFFRIRFATNFIDSIVSKKVKIILPTGSYKNFELTWSVVVQDEWLKKKKNVFYKRFLGGTPGPTCTPASALCDSGGTLPPSPRHLHHTLPYLEKVRHITSRYVILRQITPHYALYAALRRIKPQSIFIKL